MAKWRVKKYRKKPVAVVALQLTENNLAYVAKWCGADFGYTFGARDPDSLDVHTPEGTMAAYIGDFIIKDIKGDFYPCEPDIFAETYEEVQE